MSELKAHTVNIHLPHVFFSFFLISVASHKRRITSDMEEGQTALLVSELVDHLSNPIADERRFPGAELLSRADQRQRLHSWRKVSSLLLRLLITALFKTLTLPNLTLDGSN